MDLISVLTCPLRPWYLEATLAGLDQAGATDHRRFVFSDGPPSCHFQALPRGWEYFSNNDGPSGTPEAMWSVFAQALELGADRLLYCEDDIIAAPAAVARALAVEIPAAVSYVSFYDSKEFMSRGLRMQPGLYQIPALGLDGRGFWGSLCFLLPRRTMEFALTRRPAEWRMPFEPRPGGNGAADCLISWVAHKSPAPNSMVHLPSLVDHVGDISAAALVLPRRRSKNFVG